MEIEGFMISCQWKRFSYALLVLSLTTVLAGSADAILLETTDGQKFEDVTIEKISAVGVRFVHNGKSRFIGVKELTAQSLKSAQDALAREERENRRPDADNKGAGQEDAGTKNAENKTASAAGDKATFPMVLTIEGKVLKQYGYNKVSLFHSGADKEPYKTGQLFKDKERYKIEIRIPEDMTEMSPSVFYLTDMRFWGDLNMNGKRDPGEPTSE